MTDAKDFTHDLIVKIMYIYLLFAVFYLIFYKMKYV